MKKMWIVIAAVAMTLALGTAVYAATDGGADFKQMLPLMKQMHPDVSEEQLEEMYNKCHGEGGMMGGMMGNGHMQNMQDMHKSMMGAPSGTVQ